MASYKDNHRDRSAFFLVKIASCRTVLLFRMKFVFAIAKIKTKRASVKHYYHYSVELNVPLCNKSYKIGNRNEDSTLTVPNDDR